jgi:hypothetical protein
MPLPVYPPNVPTSNTIKMAERGQLNYFFANLQAITATSTAGSYGNATSAPVAPAVTSTSFGPIVYGIPPCKAIEGFAQDYCIEIDAYGSTAGAGPSATVAVLGSLDGVDFYNLVTVAVTTVGTLFSLAKSVTPGIKVRYLTAAVITYGGVASTTDSVTAGFIF